MVQRLWAIAPGPEATEAETEGAVLAAAALAAVLQHLAREPGKWRHLHLCFGFPAPSSIGEPPASALVLALNTESHVLDIAELRAAQRVDHVGRQLLLTDAAGARTAHRVHGLGAAGPLRAWFQERLPLAGSARTIACRRLLWLPALSQSPPPKASDRLITGATSRPLQVFAPAAAPSNVAVAPLGYHADVVFELVAGFVSETFGTRRRIITDRAALHRLAGLPDQPMSGPQPVDVALGSS